MLVPKRVSSFAKFHTVRFLPHSSQGCSSFFRMFTKHLKRPPKIHGRKFRFSTFFQADFSPQIWSKIYIYIYCQRWTFLHPVGKNMISPNWLHLLPFLGGLENANVETTYSYCKSLFQSLTWEHKNQFLLTMDFLVANTSKNVPNHSQYQFWLWWKHICLKIPNKTCRMSTIFFQPFGAVSSNFRCRHKFTSMFFVSNMSLTIVVDIL